MGKLKALLTKYDDFRYLNPEVTGLIDYLKEKAASPNRRHKGIELIEQEFHSFEYHNVIAAALNRLNQTFRMQMSRVQYC